MSQFHHIQYELAAQTIAGITAAPAAKTPILCLHGWLDNAASFVPLMQQLPNYPLVAIDWPGHGQSQHRSADAHYHFIDYVSDLYALFQHQKWSKLHIIGHSMGGMIASVFAAAFPEHVSKLSLIDAFGLITAEVDQTTDTLRQGLVSRQQNIDKQKRQFSSIDHAIKARMMVSQLDEANARLLVERAVEKTTQGWQWRSDKRIKTLSPYRFCEAQAANVMQNIRCPLQVIYAAQGLAMVEQNINKYHEQIQPDALHCIAGGHHLHMQQATEVAKALKEFVDLKN